MKIVEKKVKRILGESKVADYTINPYVGCQHACFYCYAEYYMRKKLKIRQWGNFVFVKVNAAETLEREVKNKKRGWVWLSSFTDPYQPIEEKYGITRKILEVLLRNNWPVIVQTKSSLVLRDLDLLKNFENLEVGLTVNMLDEDLRRKVEPFSSSIEERLETLEKLKKEGIETYLFVGPLLFPIVEFKEIEELIEWGLKNCDKVYVDKFRVKPGLVKKWEKFVEENFRIKGWRNIVTSDIFWKKVKETLKEKFDEEIVLLF
ncbi:MAG: radical SAM protein [Candidatus Aenigmarchaeota archaeon]|nr:radical SAM protein [Candidatus Aenigmarchaeota archaeon]